MARRGKNVLNSTSKALVELDDRKEDVDLHLRFDSPGSDPETGWKCTGLIHMTPEWGIMQGGEALEPRK